MWIMYVGSVEPVKQFCLILKAIWRTQLYIKLVVQHFGLKFFLFRFWESLWELNHIQKAFWTSGKVNIYWMWEKRMKYWTLSPECEDPWWIHDHREEPVYWILLEVVGRGKWMESFMCLLHLRFCSAWGLGRNRQCLWKWNFRRILQRQDFRTLGKIKGSP